MPSVRQKYILVKKLVAGQILSGQHGVSVGQNEKGLQLLATHRAMPTDLIIKTDDPVSIVSPEQDQVPTTFLIGKTAQFWKNLFRVAIRGQERQLRLVGNFVRLRTEAAVAVKEADLSVFASSDEKTDSLVS